MQRTKLWTVVFAGFSLALAACLCTSALPTTLLGGGEEAEESESVREEEDEAEESESVREEEDEDEAEPEENEAVVEEVEESVEAEPGLESAPAEPETAGGSIEGVADFTGTLEPGQMQSQTMADDGLHTWTLTGDTLDEVTVTVTPGNAEFDPRLRFYSPSGGNLMLWDKVLDGEQEVMPYILVDPGDYIVTVEPFGGTGGPYTILLELKVHE
jgi:hypothetical protein